MDLTQLRYFVAIAECGGFGAASNVLHVAQSALSRQIRLLEHACGGPLFERNPRGVSLTQSGTILLEHARTLLRQAEAARIDVQAENAEPSGTLRLGTSPSVASVLYQPLASRFLARFPRVRLQLVETIAPDSLSMLTRGDLDLAIAARRGQSDLVEFRPLFLERMCLFGLPGDPHLAGGLPSLDRLLDVPLVVPVGAGWMPALQVMLGDRMARIRLQVEVVSMICMKQMVAARLGYGVVPLWTMRDDVAAGRFQAMPLEGFSMIRALALPRGRPIGRIGLALAEAIREQVADMAAAGVVEMVPA
jgi:LysR family nitrogen assimilation transcriptional regulator